MIFGLKTYHLAILIVHTFVSISDAWHTGEKPHVPDLHRPSDQRGLRHSPRCHGHS
jgi:hypothetical protein